MLRVLELYAGIGGAAAALDAFDLRIETVALDIDHGALAVYAENFPPPTHTTVVKHFDTVPSAWLASHDADLWWASPPCQPFTRRGRQRALDDPRADTFRALLRQIDAVRPPSLAIENVVGFETSPARDALIATLDRVGYAWRETLLCPSELALPNRRPRYYLAASQRGEPSVVDRRPRQPAPRLRDLLDPCADQDTLRVDDALARRYDGALHIVDAEDDDAISTCFTSAYGRSPVRSGSYLRLPDGGIRRFAPSEILRLLDFPPRYALPTTLPLSSAWRLIGNSLALEPVRRLLATLPDLANAPRHLSSDHHPSDREESPC